jgi:MoaA/NifB/PqqE/SkfB family radical SAM enzyme
MESLSWLIEKKLVVWGAGNNGQSFAKASIKLGIPIEYFVDSNSMSDRLSLGNSTFSIYKPERLYEEVKGTVHILISVFKNEQIVEQLTDRGYKEDIHFKSLSGNLSLIVYEELQRLTYPHDFVEKPELFKQVEIETVNRCNNACTFCPGNKYKDTRKLELMNDTLFNSIIENLHDIGYDGSIALFGTGEPLMDPDIIKRVKLVKRMLPNCFHYFLTNGILLTHDIYNEITPYLDSIEINNYSENLELLENLREISDYIELNPELKNKTKINNRLSNEILSTRGGYAGNKEIFSVPKVICSMPFQQLTIRSTGIVSMCCSDYLPIYDIGDLNKQTVSEIWNNKQFVRIRRALLDNGRPGLALCNKCDLEPMLRHNKTE